MGLIYRCVECDKEMVLESFHRGRAVKCPHCRGQNTVPDNLDFSHASDATLRDVNRGGLLLFFGIASAVVGCAPVTGVVWWLAAGAIQRAREDDREIEPALVWAKWIAAAGTVVAIVFWGLFGLWNL